MWEKMTGDIKISYRARGKFPQPAKKEGSWSHCAEPSEVDVNVCTVWLKVNVSGGYSLYFVFK